ncbi:MAG: ABC transporter permease [Desulfovibrio sp.]|nr:ABC transporter permease [Desulfovibrio sp.]
MDTSPHIKLNLTATGELNITVGGVWHLGGERSPSLKEAHRLALDENTKSLKLSQAGLGAWDSSLLVFLVDIVRTAKERKLTYELELEEGLTRLLDLAFAVKSQKGAERKKSEPGFFERTGEAVLGIIPSVRDFLEFLGGVMVALGHFFLGRAAMRRQDFLKALGECSVEALPIVSVVNLLFGLILAFVGAVQLMQFGVQIYVAGLVGIGMLRVMGAVMVGIVMSGRIGASYAALLGTMQVNEEIDALTTMGFSPMEFLVLPRLLALIIMVPLLTIYADLLGIFGGYLVGTLMLDISPMEYLTATCNMVNFKQGLIGLAYATTFGVVIALAGCYQGIRCGRSAQAVGQATTQAVVNSIVGIIVMTAIITIICNVLKV